MNKVATFYQYRIPSLRRYIQHRQYEILLISLLILVFSDTFQYSQSFSIWYETLPLQMMFIGLVIFYPKKRLRRSITLITSLSSVFLICKNNSTYTIPNSDWHSLIGIMYVLYFIIISIEVYRNILQAKRVTREMISAVICGFVLLCLLTTFLFNQVEVLYAHSFSNIGTGEKNRLDNLNYFSFVTLLSIGYGDITPITLIAKRMVMIAGLTGYFYTVFVTGIVIGKYINHSQAKIQNDKN